MSNVKHPLSKVDCSRGAPMGRSNTIPEGLVSLPKLSIRKLPLVDGDYDQGGAYWGGNSKAGDIYRAVGGEDENFVEIFVRAHNRNEAKDRITKELKL